MQKLTIDTVRTGMIEKSIPVNGSYEGLPAAALNGIKYSIEFGYDVWEKQTTLGASVRELVKELAAAYKAGPQYFAVTFTDKDGVPMTITDAVPQGDTIIELLGTLCAAHWDISLITKIEAIPTPEA